MSNVILTFRNSEDKLKFENDYGVDSFTKLKKFIFDTVKVPDKFIKVILPPRRNAILYTGNREEERKIIFERVKYIEENDIAIYYFVGYEDGVCELGGSDKRIIVVKG